MRRRLREDKLPRRPLTLGEDAQGGPAWEPGARVAGPLDGEQAPRTKFVQTERRNVSPRVEAIEVGMDQVKAPLQLAHKHERGADNGFGAAKPGGKALDQDRLTCPEFTIQQEHIAWPGGTPKALAAGARLGGRSSQELKVHGGAYDCARKWLYPVAGAGNSLPSATRRKPEPLSNRPITAAARPSPWRRTIASATTPDGPAKRSS